MLSPDSPDFFNQADFTRLILTLNHWNENTISKGVFSPGMMFGAMDKWWGDLGKRSIPHEGLDVGLCKDGAGQFNILSAATKIPAIYDGSIVKIMDDFLGKTLIMAHTSLQRNGRFLLTIFGHAAPDNNIRLHTAVKRGQRICGISRPAKSTKVLPHLHITMGWASFRINFEHLDWNTMPRNDLLHLLDPAPILNWPFEVLPTNAPVRLKGDVGC
jgi:hypothetical protein